MFVPVLGSFLALAAGFGFQFQLEGRQHRFIKNAFQFYVSASVIDKIVDDPARLALGGEKRDLTIFFSDIKGFTSISEALDASQLLHLLNEYLTLMTETVLETGGTVDKYVGDAVVAFWNAPLSVPDHAEQAARAAILCQQRLAAKRPYFKEQYKVDLKTRIGLNSGLTNVGNFGSQTRFNYTMIGDAANLASRLEGVNKAFGTSILISHSTYSGLSKNIICRKVGGIQVIGKAEVVTVYEPYMPDLKNFSLDSLPQYMTGIDAFARGDLDEAARAFSGLSEDPVAESYLERIKEERVLQKDGAVWSPVWVMKDK